MLPDVTVRYPHGMGGLDLEVPSVRRYLGRRITVLLGDADTDTAAHDLPRMPEALAQGPHRLARGQWYVAHCKSLAKRLAVPFAWQLDIVPNAGHVDATIFERALEMLAD